MRIRVGTRGIRGVLSVSELLNPFTHAWISVQLCSHKLLRWAVPVLLIALFVSSVVLLRVPAFQIATGMQVAFYGLAVLTAYVPLHRKASILGIPLYFCTLNAAVLMSVIEVVRRRQYTVWETIR